MQNHDNVEQVHVNVNNVFGADVTNVVVSGGNVDLNGSSRNPSSVNDDGVSSGAEFDDDHDGQDVGDDDDDNGGGDFDDENDFIGVLDV
jgi:hypothetical protein